MSFIPLELELRTARLRLRIAKADEQEIDFVWEATQYPGFNDGMLWDAPESKAELMRYAENIAIRWRSGDCFLFTFCDLQEGRPLGRITLEEAGSGWSVGFWTHPKFQGAGFASEALGEISRFAFEVLAVEELFASHVDWNIASRRVLEKNGFLFRFRREREMGKSGGWVSEETLALTCERWRSSARLFPAGEDAIDHSSHGPSDIGS